MNINVNNNFGMITQNGRSKQFFLKRLTFSNGLNYHEPDADDPMVKNSMSKNPMLKMEAGRNQKRLF